MKLSEFTAQERTAIAAWIRVSMMVREQEFMKVTDDFKMLREQSICANPASVPQMVKLYAAYQSEKQMLSYTQYFRVSHPDEYAAMVIDEKLQRAGSY